MKNVCYYLLNGINDVFLDPEIIQQREDRLLALRNSNSRDGLYITRDRRLGYDPVPICTWLADASWITAYSFKPVISNTKERLEKNPFIESFLVILEREEFGDSGMKGIDALTEEEIFFEKTTKQQNIDWYEEHLEGYNAYHDNVRMIRLSSGSGRVHDDIERFIYESK